MITWPLCAQNRPILSAAQHSTLGFTGEEGHWEIGVRPENGSQMVHTHKEVSRELGNFGPGEGANHVIGCHVEAGVDFLSGDHQTSHSWLPLSAGTQGTDTSPWQTLIFRLPTHSCRKVKNLQQLHNKVTLVMVIGLQQGPGGWGNVTAPLPARPSPHTPQEEDCAMDHQVWGCWLQ